MFTITKSVPSAGSIFSSYTTFAASAMVAKTALRELESLTCQFIPSQIRTKIIECLSNLFNLKSSSTDEATMTITIKKSFGISVNELFAASETYLGTRITPSNTHLEASKRPRETHISLSISRGESILDNFDGVDLVWRLSTTSSAEEPAGSSSKTASSRGETTAFKLSFKKRFMNKVVGFYLPHVTETAKKLNSGKKKVRLFSLGSYGDMDCLGNNGPWGCVDFDHPSTFETMAMDEELKKMVMEDLDRFLERKEFYKRVGKAWKRGYLLYGPPGTGKSSLVAAMSNYLKFDVYDLQLSDLIDLYDLRQLLVSVTNKSIIVIEDIDCSVKLENRADIGTATPMEAYDKEQNKLALSELLNFADGLWSSLGDERIIVFTTNYKDRLDPALLRPGRMDLHIPMSYLTPCGFKTLASNYLRIKDHPLFGEIAEKLKEVEVTPAEVAEQLMRSDDANEALEGLVEFLQGKKDDKLFTSTNVDYKNIGTNRDGKEQGMEVDEECDDVKRVDMTNKRKKEMMIKKEIKSSSSTTIKRCRLDRPEGHLINL